jgi:hypothetical protein
LIRSTAISDTGAGKISSGWISTARTVCFVKLKLLFCLIKGGTCRACPRPILKTVVGYYNYDSQDGDNDNNDEKLNNGKANSTTAETR